MNIENSITDKNYVWYDDELFDENDLDYVKRSFHDLSVEKNRDAAIGAGASGLNPEIQLLLYFIGIQVAGGFLQKVGSDIWDKIKTLFCRISEMKPKMERCGYPKDFMKNHAFNFDLLIHLYTERQQYLIIITLENSVNVSKALSLLPDFLDKIIQSDEQVHRIFWTKNGWGYC